MATRKSFTMSTKERSRRTFSENFKKEKVQQIERGEFKASDIVKLYEVSYTSVANWLNKYGSEKKPERLIVETESDSKMLLSQREKIAELERLVGQKQIEVEFYKKLIDIAEDQYSIQIKKKLFYPVIRQFWINREEYTFSMNSLFKAMNITKQSFHQYHNRFLKSLELEGYLRVVIHQIRNNHPTMGCRDMYYKIKPEGIGRDLFEEFCFLEGFTIDRVKNYRRTTNSCGVTRFKNHTENLVVKKINQLWVSDITFYELNGRFYYITFIVDVYSRRIIGHKTSKRLVTEQTTLPALKMAIRTRNKEGKAVSGVIFHSDGGGQYYDKEFLKLTQRYEFINSMCIYPWENPYAERINGVIKNNYLIKRNIDSYDNLIKEVDRSVKLYNSDKPHKSLARLTPIEFEKTIFAKGKCSADVESTEKEKSLTPAEDKPCGLKTNVAQTSDVTKKDRNT